MSDDGGASTALEREIRNEILANGPISVARYMALCLGHPRYGYYVTRDPFGVRGDFTTAPEISQMFGELLGIWAVAVWQAMGSPARLNLVELGPGRGTLMADALRAACIVPGFRDAAQVHLVETSPVLREGQRQTLAAATDVHWHETLATVPPGTSIVVGNEFIDALPVHQAVRMSDGWHERVIGIDETGHLAFGLAPSPLPGAQQVLPPQLADAPIGAVYEWRSDAVVSDLCAPLHAHPGAVLLIDYGHAESAFGDTLQAVRHHAFADPLLTPGESDLTAHVDFAAIARAAQAQEIAVHGPVGQGDFLRRLGIEARAAKLRAAASSQQTLDIDAALQRLTGSGPNEMGALFRVIALATPSLATPPGFDS